ncbi:hypothetical protein Y025_5571 [Burkholderia pseudomallei TSV32]|nr:hypothetical protein Y025_5571 [Burkholderia pseudomallei TSV32]
MFDPCRVMRRDIALCRMTCRKCNMGPQAHAFGGKAVARPPRGGPMRREATLCDALRRARDVRRVAQEAFANRFGDAVAVEAAQRQQLRRIAVIDETVRQAELQHRADGAAFHHRLDACGTRAAHHAALLDGDEVVVRPRERLHELGVDRLHEAHVRDGRVKRVGRRERRRHHRAERENRDALAVRLRRAAAHFALAERDLGKRLDGGNARARAARITHGGRVRLLQRGMQHLAALVLVRRGHHRHVRNAAQEREIVRARVRRAVRADEARAVDREHDGQVLQRDVVNQLIISALQERRIDRHDRLEPFRREAARERHRVLLGDADVVVALREAFLELDHARAFAHRGRDADHARIEFRRVAQPFAEHLRVGLLRGRRRRFDAFRRVELAGPVIEHRVGLGELVALALLRHDVQELRPAQLLDVLQRRDQRIEIVPVDRPDVVEAEFLEEGGRHDHALRMLLELARELQHGRRDAQHALHARTRGRVEAARHQAREMAIQRADGRRDRHVVVVQDHEQLRVLRHARVVHRLERHAGRHRAVADHRDREAVVAVQLAADRHPERGRDRRARVCGAERVVFGFRAARKARDAVELAQRLHPVAAARQDLVRIGLVTDVPHDPVVRRIEHVMQRDRQLDRTEIGRQMAARLRHAVEDERAQLVGERLQLATIETAQVRRIVDGFQQVVHRRSIVGKQTRPHFLRAHPWRGRGGGLSRQLTRFTTRSASSARRCARAPNGSSAACASARNCAASARDASRPMIDT